VAIVWANSPWQDSYHSLFDAGTRHWVDDGLMVVFFFVVGLEIRREIVSGELRRPRSAALPAIAAIGGMLVPAAIYAACNAGHPGSRGWGIPMATDIAFAVGVVALAGSRLPSSLRVFLLALAIVDDIGAIVVIAVIYSTDVHVWSLVAAAGLLAVVVALRDSVAARLPVFLLLGFGVWLAIYDSGVHATVAGVALGFAAPAALAGRLEQRLHPWSSYAVVPIFALANAGVTFGTGALDAPGATRVLVGIVVGLVVGKTIGISAATWLAVRAGVGVLPADATWRDVVGLASVAGIGFTVSLFVAGLAFSPGTPLEDTAKIGVLVASTAAAVIGSTALIVGRAAAPRR